MAGIESPHLRPFIDHLLAPRVLAGLSSPRTRLALPMTPPMPAAQPAPTVHRPPTKAPSPAANFPPPAMPAGTGMPRTRMEARIGPLAAAADHPPRSPARCLCQPRRAFGRRPSAAEFWTLGMPGGGSRRRRRRPPPETAGRSRARTRAAGAAPPGATAARAPKAKGGRRAGDASSRRGLVRACEQDGARASGVIAGRPPRILP